MCKQLRSVSHPNHTVHGQASQRQFTIFMTKSSQKNVPDVGVDLGTTCITSGITIDQATAPGYSPLLDFLFKLLEQLPYSHSGVLRFVHYHTFAGLINIVV